jgi:ABC-type Fe3+-hydroxamate transport system substrate-binding protein
MTGAGRFAIWDFGFRIADLKRHVLFILLAVVAAGCQRPATNIAPSQPMHQVTDDLGRTVTVPVKITRVVSTAPSVTENVFAVGAGDRLVGVTTFCNYPEEAKAIEKIGDTMTPNIERIVALKPDVVLVSSASQLENFMKILEQNGITVYVSNPTSLDDMLKGLKQLGELFGTQEKAEKTIEDLDRRVKTTVPRQRTRSCRTREYLFRYRRSRYLRLVNNLF